MCGNATRCVAKYVCDRGLTNKDEISLETLSGIKYIKVFKGDDGKVKYFEGTPIPTSIVLVGLLALAGYLSAVRENLWFGQVLIGGFTLHPLVLLFALSGSLMISRIRIPKL